MERKAKVTGRRRRGASPLSTTVLSAHLHPTHSLRGAVDKTGSLLTFTRLFRSALPHPAAARRREGVYTFYITHILQRITSVLQAAGL